MPWPDQACRSREDQERSGGADHGTALLIIRSIVESSDIPGGPCINAKFCNFVNRRYTASFLGSWAHGGYRIHPKVRLADAINKDPGECLPDRKFDYLSRAHFDFLIVKDDSPVFAVEFDGIQYHNDAAAIERDVHKHWHKCRTRGSVVITVQQSRQSIQVIRLCSAKLGQCVCVTGEIVVDKPIPSIVDDAYEFRADPGTRRVEPCREVLGTVSARAIGEVRSRLGGLHSSVDFIPT